MANYTTYVDGSSTINTKAVGSPTSPEPKVYVGVYDAAKRTLTTSDNAQILSLPVGFMVEDVFVEILTEDAGGAGLNVGDAAVAAAYGAYATLSATGKLAVAAGSATTYLYTNTTNAKVKPTMVTSGNLQNIRIAPSTQSVTTLKVKVTVKGFQS